MHILLCAAPSKGLLMLLSLRALTFLSFSPTSWRGAGWYELQQQFPEVMHAVVAEKFGKSASGAPVLFSFPEGEMVLAAIEPGPAKEMSNSRASSVSLYHFQALGTSINDPCVLLQVLGNENWQDWGKVGRRPVCTPSLGPRVQDLFASGSHELQSSSWGEAITLP